MRVWLSWFLADLPPAPAPVSPELHAGASPTYFDLAIAGVAVCIAITLMTSKLLRTWSKRSRFAVLLACILTVAGLIGIAVIEREHLARRYRVQFDAEQAHYKTALKDYDEYLRRRAREQ